MPLDLSFFSFVTFVFTFPGQIAESGSRVVSWRTGVYSDRMTIFQAKEYDPSVDQRRRLYWIAGLIAAVIVALLVYHFWDWREEHTVNKFLTAIEHKDFEKAYAIWNADPNWKQHPQKYSGYNFGTFDVDWGPTGEYGEIRSHRIREAITPKNASGVVVVSMINDRREPLALWVEKKDQSITFLPPTLNIRIEP